MSNSEVETGLSDYFKDVLARADEIEQRYDEAVARHASTSNPVLRIFTGVSLRARAAALEDTQAQAAVVFQKEQLQTGKIPMFED